MKKRIIALAVSVLMLISTLPISVSASDSAQVTAENATATQGGYAYVYLRADNFVDVAVLDIEVYYDASVMSVFSVSNFTMFNGASVSTNYADAGIVKISAMSVKGFNSTSNSASNRMVRITFKMNADCPAGDQPVRVTVGHAYDSSFAPAVISGSTGKITVSEATPQTFTIKLSKNLSTVSLGDAFTLTTYHTSSDTFASADFHVEYDRELFRVKSVRLDSNLQQEGMVSSINSDNPGIVVISFASTNKVTTSDLFKVVFEVIADVDTSAKIKVSAKDVYTDELMPYLSYSTSTSMTLKKSELEPDYPDVMLSADRFVVGETASLGLSIEGGAEVAAGDFVISYDKSFFSVEDVQASTDALEHGALVIINPRYDDGEIRFSYVNTEGGADEDITLLCVTLTPISDGAGHSVISVSGTDVCDINYNETQLEYVGWSDCVYSASLTEPTNTTEGALNYTCSCGEHFAPKIGVLGDIDADGDFTNIDVTLMLRYLSGWKENIAGDGWSCPVRFLDLNRDGKINNRDAIIIINKLCGN